MPQTDDLSDLDAYQLELYDRRSRELTLFGTFTESEAHERALRFARGMELLAPVELRIDDWDCQPMTHR